MLQLFDINHNKLEGLKNYKEYYIQREINQLDILSFKLPIIDPKHDLIQEECYIRTKDNEYIVKEINYADSDNEWTEYVCKVNIEGIQGKPVKEINTVQQKCSDAVNLALAGTGWSLGNCDVIILRNVCKANCTVYDVLQEIQKAYLCEMTFDAVNKLVNVYQKVGSDKGVYFSDQLNLSKLQIQRNSYDYITRLIPIGSNGLDITSVNNGKNYIENYQYSNKVLTGYWEDNKYTVAKDLYDDAVTRLAYLSVPIKAYGAAIIDLANVSQGKYSILDYDLGDFITLLSKTKNVKEQQRIVKILKYPDEPERNTVELANKILSLDALNVRFQDTSNIVDSVTTSDGMLDGSKVGNIDWDNIDHIHVATADLEDASITTAKIGDAQITQAKITNAAIGNAQIQNAAIGTANIQAASITTALIGTGAVDTEQVADGSITDAKIVSLTANKITAGTIDAGEIDVVNLHAVNITVGQINGNQIADGTIQSNNIAENAVEAVNIASGCISADKIAPGTITGDLIAAGTIKESQLNWSSHLMY
jgi:phage minor structural protein